MAGEKVRVLLRGGSYDGMVLGLTTAQRLVTLTLHPNTREVYVPTAETENRDDGSLDVFRFDPEDSLPSANLAP